MSFSLLTFFLEWVCGFLLIFFLMKQRYREVFAVTTIYIWVTAYNSFKEGAVYDSFLEALLLYTVVYGLLSVTFVLSFRAVVAFFERREKKSDVFH